MARRGMKKYMDSRVPSTFKIQITSMVDMFVILLVFLLKSYSTSPVQVNPSNELKLPQSVSQSDPVDVLKIIVSKKGIYIENKKVADLVSGQIVQQDIEANDPLFIRKLYNELDSQAKLSRSIAQVNDKLEFDGKIFMQADRDLPYSLLQKVMYTSMLAGYSDVKLAVTSKDF